MDGIRLAETASRRDVPYLCNLLEAHGIRAIDGSGPPLREREDHVPRYSHPFVGRDAVVGEVRYLLSAAGTGRRPIVAVHGLPGSGKTAVAKVVADRLRSASAQ